MPPELIPDEEEYASEEDSDFAPDSAPAKEDAESSDDEAEPEPEEVKAPKSTKRKRGPDDEAEDAGFENSGDEAIIEKGLKRQKKKSKKDKDVEDDEGGEGGLVKTRSMRAAAKSEKKVALVDTSKATVDVDALWASMTTDKPSSTPTKPITTVTSSLSKSPSATRASLALSESERKTTRSPSVLNEGPDAMILIKRTYTFAGKVHTEQKLVLRHSAEAKFFLASQASIPSPTVDVPSDPFIKPKRPPKKARRSIFEPIVDIPPRQDLKLGFRKLQEGLGNLDVEEKATKLTTVAKSKMDWAGYVDKEGIAEELDQAGKRKGGFRERQEFIARTQSRLEEDERRARGVVSISGGL